MDIILAIYSKSLTEDNTFSNYLTSVDDYSKIKKLSGMENITTEIVMYKLNTFQGIIWKLDEFGWWYIYRSQTDSGP